MPAPILPVSTVIAPIAPAPATGAALPAGAQFSTVMAEAIRTVERFGANAQASIGRFLAGEGGELHQVALETERANLSFELFMQVRNKVVSAYQEVMRMQI